MNRSHIIDNRRGIDIDKLSTQGSSSYIKECRILKEIGKKFNEEICPQHIFEQMRIDGKKKIKKVHQINETVLSERNILFARFRKIYKQLRLSNQTLHLALYYFDTLIATCGKFLNISSENVALGCLCLASKNKIFYYS